MALTNAIKVLAEFAARKAPEADPEEQIKIYQALAETLPTKEARDHARELAIAQSRVTALQLQFRELLDLN